jgi:hypothetical protein
VQGYIREKNLEQVMDDPSTIFNGDEAGFQICPSTGSVLAQNGAKNVYSIDTGSSKENITNVLIFSKWENMLSDDCVTL